MSSDSQAAQGRVPPRPFIVVGDGRRELWLVGVRMRSIDQFLEVERLLAARVLNAGMHPALGMKLSPSGVLVSSAPCSSPKDDLELDLGSHFVIDVRELEIRQEIGRGTTGSTYLARWRGTQCAVKVVHAPRQGEERGMLLTDFAREVKTPPQPKTVFPHALGLNARTSWSCMCARAHARARRHGIRGGGVPLSVRLGFGCLCFVARLHVGYNHTYFLVLSCGTLALLRISAARASCPPCYRSCSCPF